MLKVRIYNMLVYIAFAYFMLIGAAWLIINYANNRHINPYALSIMIVFGIQMWLKHKFANLIIGIIGLFLSIWTLLELVAAYNLFAKNVSLGHLGKTFLVFGFVNIIMSGILIFSYLIFNLDYKE